MANILLRNQNNVSSKMIFPSNYQNKVGVKKTTPSENKTMKMFKVYPARFLPSIRVRTVLIRLSLSSNSKYEVIFSQCEEKVSRETESQFHVDLYSDKIAFFATWTWAFNNLNSHFQVSFFQNTEKPKITNKRNVSKL